MWPILSSKQEGDCVNTLEYKDQIEALKDENDFEARGDALFMYHDDVEARLEWAFYRPSGSHPDQVSDPDPLVSIMAFNHSRLGALERFKRLHVRVINEDALRVKIRNRSRMLFRAMVDDDLNELMEVLEMAPVFLDQACDQMINGRIWNDTWANPVAASRFIAMVEDRLDSRLLEGIKRRLQPIKDLGFEAAKLYLEQLLSQEPQLHSMIKAHYVAAYERWLESTSLHPLQRIALAKEINKLKDHA
jgi:hypothetical protein